jgi:hypothetical protein
MRRNTIIWLGSLLLAILLAAGCGVLTQNAASRKADKHRIAMEVHQRLDERHFTFVPERIFPTRGTGRYIGGEGYSLVIDGQKIKSHLPFEGVAYGVPYGGGKVFTFEDELKSFEEVAGTPDSRVFEFSTDNGEDLINYRLTVYANGGANMDVRSRNRSQVSYRGAVSPDIPGKEQPEE